MKYCNFRKSPDRFLSLWHSPRLWLCALILLLPLAAAPVLADEAKQGNRTPVYASQNTAMLSQATVTIQEKNRQSVVTSAGRRFAVNHQTFIVGLDGKEVKIEKMLVPCQVEISFATPKGVPTAKRIVIRSVSSNASTDMGFEAPH